MSAKTIRKIQNKSPESVDASDAPDGFFAKLQEDDDNTCPCDGCAFEADATCCHTPFTCIWHGRADLSEVIFIKKEKNQ